MMRRRSENRDENDRKRVFGAQEPPPRRNWPIPVIALVLIASNIVAAVLSIDLMMGGSTLAHFVAGTVGLICLSLAIWLMRKAL